MKKLITFLIIFIYHTSYANRIPDELLADINAYCRYVQVKNEAKKKALIAPNVIIRAQNTDNDYPYQNNLITALSKDLAELGKAWQLKNLIEFECAYYQLKQEAILQIEFALSSVQKKALRYKLKAIRLAKLNLETYAKKIWHKINQHEDTISNFYQADAALHEPFEAERKIELELAQRQPQGVKAQSIRNLISNLASVDKKRQAVLNKIEKFSNWSLMVQAGAQHNAYSFYHTDNAQPYGALLFRYNLSSIASNKSMDTSLNEYSNWKAHEVTGLQRKLWRLEETLTLFKNAQKKRLKHLIIRHNKYQSMLMKLDKINSSKAHKFELRLKRDQMMLEIEIKYLKYLINLLGFYAI